DDDGDEPVERDRRAAVGGTDPRPLLGYARRAVDGGLARLERLRGCPGAAWLGGTATAVDARASEGDAGLSCQGHDGLPSGGVGYYTLLRTSMVGKTLMGGYVRFHPDGRTRSPDRRRASIPLSAGRESAAEQREDPRGRRPRPRR